MTEERSPWKGAAVGAGGGSLLAAALGYIYGHRGKWLAYDALTGGAVGGGLGYAVESSNKDRLDANRQKETQKTVNSPEQRAAAIAKLAKKQNAANIAFKEQKKKDDSVLLNVAGAMNGSNTDSGGWGNKLVREGARGLRKIGLPQDVSEALVDASAPGIPRAMLNKAYALNKKYKPVQKMQEKLDKIRAYVEAKESEPKQKRPYQYDALQALMDNINNK